MKPKNIIKRIKAFLKNNLPSGYRIHEVSYESVPGLGYYIAIEKDDISSGVNVLSPPSGEDMKMITKHLLFLYESRREEKRKLKK